MGGAEEPLTAALLGGTDSTLVFGWAEASTSAQLRLSYEGGAQTQIVYVSGPYSFLLSGSPRVEKLELLQDGTVIAAVDFDR